MLLARSGKRKNKKWRKKVEKRRRERFQERAGKKNEGSGKGIERGLLEQEDDTAVKRGGRKDFKEREKGFAEGNKKNDLERKDEKKNGQVRKY